MKQRSALAAFCCVIFVCGLVGTGALGASLENGTEFLARIDAAKATGELTAEEALLYEFYYGFDHDQLPVSWRPETFTPLKNATQFVWEFEAQRDNLSPRAVAIINGYLDGSQAQKESRSTYISPSGLFRLTYYITGSNAVPATDVDPANGIPDYVERIATYCDYSWDFEINQLDFGTPPLNPYYEIGFENMSYYGYTTPTGGYGTRITLHNTFLGFPPNDDPEGNQWGAAKVTVAHEFKHATQRAQSLWSEGGWVELDATWMEDIAYDVVNDYYNYLPNGSPIANPQASLDSGGTGSYDDCVWEHWMSETWTTQIVTDFWHYRETHQGQSVLQSYHTILGNYGSSLQMGWPVFTAWNYACGNRAIEGFGYGEAADYPTGSLSATFSSYPASYSGSVAHLAANFIKCTGLDPDQGLILVQFNGADASQLQLTAIIKKTDGTGVMERITLDAANDADTELSVRREEIDELGFSVSNGAAAGSNMSFSLTVDQLTTHPICTMDASSVSMELAPNQTGSSPLGISNTGDEGSILNYEVFWEAATPAPSPDKSISGSTVTCASTNYVPNTTLNMMFTLHNASSDGEWLKRVTLDFPAGGTVNSSTNFVGGSGGDLVTNGNTGDGVIVTWAGDTGSPNFYGLVGPGESATATVNVSWSPSLSGPQVLIFVITGDNRGATPHVASGVIVLQQGEPALLVTAPDGGERWSVGGNEEISWNTAASFTEVRIDLSRNGGGSWETLVASTDNDGSYTWTVAGPVSANCLVRISSLDDAESDVSDGAFTIYEPAPWLSVSPTSGSLAAGESDVLTLMFDTTGMTEGTYYASVLINHNAVGNPTVIPVTLVVTGTPSGVADVPLNFALQGNYPNPFNPRTNIAFSLPQTADVEVSVLDLQGKLVRRLWAGQLAAGPQVLQWDGQDDGGQPVAAGTYVARLRMGGSTLSTKMLLAK